MTVAAIVPCGRCGVSVAGPRGHVAHLVEFHLMTVERAREEVRSVAPAPRPTQEMAPPTNMENIAVATTSARCGYCKQPKDAHRPYCRRAGAPQAAGICACGGRSRHKPGCKQYMGKAQRQQKPSDRRGPRPAARTASRTPPSPDGLMPRIRALIETVEAGRAAERELRAAMDELLAR